MNGDTSLMGESDSLMSGRVLSIERCSLHDGPGLRTTVFLMGCPLSCLWCHNPESQSFRPTLYYFDEKCVSCGLCGTVCKNHRIQTEIKEASTAQMHHIDRRTCVACGKCVTACPRAALEIKGVEMTVDEVLTVAMKDRRYYAQSGGGLTLSGGEPLAQFNFTQALLGAAKENGLHTCLETCGHAPTERLLALVPHVDLFLYDFKESDDELHRRYTGVSHDLIMNNLLEIDRVGAPCILRCPIIPGYNDRTRHFRAIAATANTLRHIQAVHIMVYHPMGASKAKRVGRTYPLPELGFPTEAQIEDWLHEVQQGTTVPVKKG